MVSLLDSLCASDCDKILKRKLKSCDFKLKSYKAYPLDEVKGFLGNYYYLLIDYRYENLDESSRFFVKIKPTSGPHQIWMDENNIFSKECQFYEKLVSDILDSEISIISDCVPQCYFISDGRYLIFEDLTMQGYADIGTRDPVSLDYMKAGLDALAKLHCSGLIYEEKMKEKGSTNFNLLQKYSEIFQESFFNRNNMSKRLIEAAKEAIECIIDINSKHLNTNIQLFKKLACDVYDNFHDVVEPSTTYRNTICHGDLWCANIMSKFQNNKPIHSYMVDFQMVRYSPPAQDFMSFIYFTTDKKFRHEHMKHLVEYYYKTMTELFSIHDLSLTKILPYEEFIESCSYYKLFACAIGINHHQFGMLPADAMSELLKEGFLQNMVFEGRPKVIQDYCKRDDFYRERLKEDITEFRDILIERKQL